jgi:hypothetical protein
MKPGSIGDVGDVVLRVPLLESLYRDQIPPTASNLRCRWQEIVTEYEKISGRCPFSKKITVQGLLKMYTERPDTLVIVDHEVEGAAISNCDGKRTALLKQLAAKPGKVVPPEVARKEAPTSMKLRSEPEIFLAGFRVSPKWFEGFVDPMGPDLYPEEMWTKLAEYLHTMLSDDSENWFQGGRYGAAKDLRRRQLPFLEGRSLGELSHIVQLALTNEHDCRGGRGLLSYQPDKTIAPRALSQRHLLADLGLPVGQSFERCVGQGCQTDEERWQELCHVLQVVLSEHSQGRSLALLKVDIERRFGMVLDQSVFREVKLSRVFESPKLRHLFEVRRGPSQAGGPSQVIVRLKDPASSLPMHASNTGLPATPGPVTVPPPGLPASTKGTTQVPMQQTRGTLPAVNNFRPVGRIGASNAVPEPAKVGLSAPRVIKPPPGLAASMSSGDNVADNTDCCPPGFALAQGFCDPSPEDFAANTGQDFFGPGLHYAEDLLEEEFKDKDSNFLNGLAKGFELANLMASHTNSTAPALAFQNSLWSTGAANIWGKNSLLGPSLDVQVTA